MSMSKEIPEKKNIQPKPSNESRKESSSKTGSIRGRNSSYSSATRGSGGTGPRGPKKG